MAKGLIFRIQDVKILYYPCSENKGADQLRGHREADLRLCFHISYDAAQMINFRTAGSVLPDVVYEWLTQFYLNMTV